MASKTSHLVRKLSNFLQKTTDIWIYIHPLLELFYPAVYYGDSVFSKSEFYSLEFINMSLQLYAFLGW